MAHTKKPDPAPAATPRTATEVAVNGPADTVLTLPEAAAYLRFSEADVLRLVDDQGLPARRLANEWRFLKSAIQKWLSTPFAKKSPEGIWAAAGSWKDDPYLDEMLQEIHRRRGRPETEE